MNNKITKLLYILNVIYMHILHDVRNNIYKKLNRGVARSKYVGWTEMASAKRQPITRVWRRSPQRATPLPPPP